jgi:putative ABC transport system permease protein
MLSPRWRKVLGDLWSNKTRTILVVLSIAVGVFAIGMVGGARVILIRDLTGTWMSVNPASATLTTEALDDELVQVVRKMPGVSEAEARRTIAARVKVGPEEWKNMSLLAIPDFDDIRINTVRPLSGAWPPKAHAVLLERATSSFLGVRPGEMILIELPDGKQRTLQVDGLVHNPGECPPALCKVGLGYITLDTAEWLGQPGEFNLLNIVVADKKFDTEHIKAIASQVQTKLEKSGRIVFGTVVLDPGKHPLDAFVTALIWLMGIIAFFALLLSGFLVVNTVGALLTQQTRQIGVMKSIGARHRDIVGMYLVTVLAFGLLSLFVAVPLGVLGAWALSSFFAGAFNFDITTVSVPPLVLGLQVMAGLLIPLLAALVPVLSGTRITVREAISGYGLGKGRFGTGRIDRLLVGLDLVSKLRFLSRPMLLSLRNTFRRKGRLALTLTTLTIAGVIFMAVMSARASLNLTLDDIFAYYNYDVNVTMNRSYRTMMLDDVLKVPGVTGVEYWSSYGGQRLLADDRESTNSFSIRSLPAQTKLFRPKMREGRWLLPQDAPAVVVNTAFVKKEPDVKLGDELRLKVAGKKTTLRVVGIADILFGEPMVYVNRAYFDQVVGEVGKASQAQLLTERRDGVFQLQVAKVVEERFKLQGLELAGTRTLTQEHADASVGINIVVAFLLIMAVLLAFVGGLGLMGTMSINVIERTREIGVMRAIGATDGAVLRMVIVEGVLIGMLSWLIGALIALPVSKLMNDGVGVAFQATGLSFTFSALGVLLWLGIVIVLAALASFLPAWNASRVTVRDVLAYE